MNNLIIKKMVTKIYSKQANGKYGQPQKMVEFVCTNRPKKEGDRLVMGYGKSEAECVEDWKRSWGESIKV